MHGWMQDENSVIQAQSLFESIWKVEYLGKGSRAVSSNGSPWILLRIASEEEKICKEARRHYLQNVSHKTL